MEEEELPNEIKYSKIMVKLSSTMKNMHNHKENNISITCACSAKVPLLSNRKEKVRR